MTLTDYRDVANWWAVPATTLDHPRVADFLATTPGLAGRTFGAESRDVEEHFDGVLGGGANVVLDDTGEVRGYALLRQPRGDEIDAEFVFDPAAPAAAVDEVIGSTVAHFNAEAADRPRASLRTVVGADHKDVIDALSRLGAWREAESSACARRWQARPSQARCRYDSRNLGAELAYRDQPGPSRAGAGTSLSRVCRARETDRVPGSLRPSYSQSGIHPGFQ